MNNYNELFDEYKLVLKKTILDLFSTGEDFYYISLTVDEGGATPVFSACSKESYIAACRELPNNEDCLWIKWSYSDSPYFNYGENNFHEANQLWISKGLIDDFSAAEWDKEINKRLNFLELSFSMLYDEGIFGIDEGRNNIVLAVEIVPPTRENTERVERLNPSAAIKK